MAPMNSQRTHRRAAHPRQHLFAVAIAMAIAMIAGAIIAAPNAHADNRGWLRPGCVWSWHGGGMQECSVPSPANGYDITVTVQPAKFGGNGALYMLGGIGTKNNENQWANTEAPGMFANDNVTLVMPHGGQGQFYADWEMAGTALFNHEGQLLANTGRHKWESFLTGELPAWLQQNFGVDPHRNSIVGISMGAIPAITLAERHPDQFRQSIAMSGFLDPAALTHLVMIPGFSIATNFGGGQIWEMWGLNPVQFVNNMLKLDPVAGAEGLRNVDTIVFSGNGQLPPGHQMPLHLPTDPVIAVGGEWMIGLSSNSFVNKVRAKGINVDYQVGPGIHAWPTWIMKLQENKGRILGAVG